MATVMSGRDAIVPLLRARVSLRRLLTARAGASRKRRAAPLIAAVGALLVLTACSGRSQPAVDEPGATLTVAPAVAVSPTTTRDTPERLLVFVEHGPEQHKLLVWDLNRWKLVRTLDLSGPDSPGSAQLVGGSLLLVSSRRVEEEAIDGTSRRTLWEGEPDQVVTQVAPSPDGRLVAIGVEGRDIFDLTRARLFIVRRSDGAVVREFGQEVAGLLGAAPGPVAWMTQKDALVVLGYSHRDSPGVYALVELDGTVRKLEGTFLAFSSDGSVAAEADNLVPGCEGPAIAAQTIHFREVATGRVLSSLEAASEAYAPAAVGPSGAAVLRAATLSGDSGATCASYSSPPEYRYWDGVALATIDDPRPILRRWAGLTVDVRMDCPVDGDERPESLHFLGCWSTTAPGGLFADGRSLGWYRAVEVLGVVEAGD